MYFLLQPENFSILSFQKRDLLTQAQPELLWRYYGGYCQYCNNELSSENLLNLPHDTYLLRVIKLFVVHWHELWLEVEADSQRTTEKRGSRFSYENSFNILLSYYEHFCRLITKARKIVQKFMTEIKVLGFQSFHSN